MQFVEIPGSAHEGTGLFSFSLTLMRAARTSRASLLWTGLLISPLYLAQPGEDIRCPDLGPRGLSVSVSPTPEWNEITCLYFSSFLPLMSPADGECFHCFPFPPFWQEAAFPLDPQLRWSKRKTEWENRERKIETEEMRKQKNLTARHNGWLRFWAGTRKECCIYSRDTWIKSQLDHSMHAKSLQSCLTLCDPMDCGPPGSSVYGILQARILEWVAMSSSRGSSRPRDRTCLLGLLHWQMGSLPLCAVVSHSVVSDSL